MFSDLTVSLGMGNATNASIDMPSNAVLTIANVYTGPGTLLFAQTNYTVSEGATNAAISVIRTNGSQRCDFRHVHDIQRHRHRRTKAMNPST